MQEVSIKIKKTVDEANHPTDNHSQNQIKSEKTIVKKKSRRYLLFWILLGLVVVEAGIIAYFYSVKQTARYQSLIPDNAISAIYFNYSELNNLTNLLEKKQYNWPPFTLFKQSLADFFSKANININQIQPLFADQMVLTILPSSDDGYIKWILIATQNVNDNAFKTYLDQIGKNLKQNFNLTPDIYRQTTITEIKSLNQNYKPLYMANLKNLFILSDNADATKSLMDKILR